MVRYVDDILLSSEDRELLADRTIFAANIFHRAGVPLNLKKCQLSPCEKIDFLGY